MGPGRVVVGHPAGDDAAGLIEAEEQRLVQSSVPHLRVERFADAVLHGLAWRDEMPRHGGLLAPRPHGVRGELGPMIADDQARLAAPGDEGRQLPRDAAPRDRGVDQGGEAFLRHVVDHVEDREPAAVGELVVDRAMEPSLVRGPWRGSTDQRAFGMATVSTTGGHSKGANPPTNQALMPSPPQRVDRGAM